MHPMPLFNILWLLTGVLLNPVMDKYDTSSNSFDNTLITEPSTPVVCNCTINQGGNSYPISALMGVESAVLFYDYSNPNNSSANTGLEINNGLVLFLYEEISTGTISLFLIADIANSGSGGSLSFDINCVPAGAFVSVQDDAGEFSGSPPLISGNWAWSTCCTDGGVIENLGCNNTLNLDLLISSGIDSIVWLTGDIANPTQILLDLSGEAITINCGSGGVCCPIGLDTEITVVDAGCANSPDGMITLNPQDGTPSYSYDWSNGATTATNDNLVAGTYSVTVSDAQGCSEELEITVGFTLAFPIAHPTTLDLCTDTPMDIFDLTSVDDIVNGGNGLSVLWFQNEDLTDEITNPSNYLSGTTTVYAVVDNGSCISNPVPIELVILIIPIGNSTSMYVCEEENGMATFDLTTLDDAVSGGNGNVLWFTNQTLTNPIPDPSEFYSWSTTIYAAVEEGPCISEPVSINLIVDPKPPADPTEMHLCGDENIEAIFDLTLLEPAVSGGSGFVDWFLEIELLDPINSPTAYQTATTIVYAVVFDGVCYSDPVPVNLIVDLTPQGNPLEVSMCDNGSDQALFNLVNYNSQVSGGIGNVEWAWDAMLNDPIPNPDALLTETTIVFAFVDNGACISEPVQVGLNVVDSPIGNATFLETCADSSGLGIFNLTVADTVVSGGIGSIQWFEDALGNLPISNPFSFMSTGSTVYAQIDDGVCLSDFVPVDLNITNSVSAMPVQYFVCDHGTNSETVELIPIASLVHSGSGQVSWFLDSAGMIPYTLPEIVIGSDATIFASVTAGNCISDIVQVDIIILQSPYAANMNFNLCVDASGQVTIDLSSLDTLISGNSGNVSWYVDSALTVPIPGPVSFAAGDTVIYAVASNGICTSPPATVNLEIVGSLTANPINLEICLMDTNIAIIDLTQSDFAISGGNGTVLWFTDNMGLDTIADPTSFTTTGDTLFAMIVADGCMSELTMIPVQVASASIPLPVCEFSSNDSLSISWPSVTEDYELFFTINGFVLGSPWITQSNVLNIGNLQPGDTVNLMVTALFDSICTTPLTNSITCITDVCPAQTLSFPGLLPAYCRDEPAFIINTSPPGGQLSGQGLSGNTFFPNLVSGNTTNVSYTWEDIVTGCMYDLSALVEIVDPPVPPVVTCQTPTLNSVTFSWMKTGDEFGYQYVINHGSGSGTVLTVDSLLVVDGLNEDDEVTLSLWSVGDSPCGNSDTITLSCYAQQCPEVDLLFDDPGIICTGDDPFILDVTVSGGMGVPDIEWSGPAIIDPMGLFDPALGMMGHSDVTVLVEDNGCSYESTFVIVVLENPIASFAVDGTPCLDSILTVIFNGMAYGSAQWNWDFSNGDSVPISFPPWIDFTVKWDEPGDYEISLWIDYRGCLSDTFVMPVQIDAPLTPLEIYCEEENYYSIKVSWDPVIGATEYNASSSLGTGKLLGTTYTISDLPDDTPVSISVTATGPSACGPVTSTIDCRTPDYISPAIFISNIFSPDNDGINDILFIQSNSQIATVHTFRVFDRWGNLVFEKLQFNSNDKAYGWDGTFSGKEMNPDVYLYWAEIETKDGDVMVMAGDVTLVR